MGKLKRFRPSPAMVVASIALFVSIGGIGYAAAKIGTSDIKNGAVTTKKLHNSAVATKKIKNNAVTGAKVKDDSLTGNDINESTLSAPINVNHATTADNANQLGGLGPGAYQHRIRWALVNGPGDPPVPESSLPNRVGSA
jgi:hypothetical protein